MDIETVRKMKKEFEQSVYDLVIAFEQSSDVQITALYFDVISQDICGKINKQVKIELTI